MSDELNNYLILVSVVLGILTVKYGPRLFARCKFISSKDLVKAIKATGEPGTLRLLDVRTPEEFKGSDGYIQGSVNVPMGDLMIEVKDLAQELDTHKDEAVYVVCKTGLRAAKAARVLKKHGFTNVQVLQGGLDVWKNHDFPVIRPDMG